jgi:hypothetical protein
MLFVLFGMQNRALRPCLGASGIRRSWRAHRPRSSLKPTKMRLVRAWHAEQDIVTLFGSHA